MGNRRGNHSSQPGMFHPPQLALLQRSPFSFLNLHLDFPDPHRLAKTCCWHLSACDTLLDRCVHKPVSRIVASSPSEIMWVIPRAPSVLTSAARWHSATF
jgi:hypothetical protein